MAANKADSGAIGTFGEANYSALPKSVLAMIAYSFAQRIVGSADRDDVLGEIEREWDALHANGIVPQKSNKMESRSQEAVRIESYDTTRCDDGPLGVSNRARVAVLRA